MKYYRQQQTVEALTFQELVEYGRQHSDNIVNGMPWSFNFHGCPVTHEHDECYLIHGTHCVTPDTMLIMEDDGPRVVSRDEFNATHTIYDPTVLSAVKKLTFKPGDMLVMHMKEATTAEAAQVMAEGIKKLLSTDYPNVGFALTPAPLATVSAFPQTAKELERLFYYIDSLKSELYSMEEGTVGGPLHIVLDDFNYGDNALQFCYEQLDGSANREFAADYSFAMRSISRAILDAVKVLTPAQRVICFHYWDYGSSTKNMGGDLAAAAQVALEKKDWVVTSCDDYPHFKLVPPGPDAPAMMQRDTIL